MYQDRCIIFPVYLPYKITKIRLKQDSTLQDYQDKVIESGKMNFNQIKLYQIKL